MKRPIAMLGIALAAVGTTAAVAGSGDTWQGTYRGDTYVRVAPSSEITIERVAPREVIVYDDRYYVAQGTPVIVDRRYVYEPVSGYYYVYRDPTVMYDPLHPQMGQLIDHGLFNRHGPNDFGS